MKEHREQREAKSHFQQPFEELEAYQIRQGRVGIRDSINRETRRRRREKWKRRKVET